MLSYIIPTHDRPEQLAVTLAQLAALDHSPVIDAFGGVEIIVADNASSFPVMLPPRLRNGLAVRVLHRPTNEAAAGRNAGAKSASGSADDESHWLLMLDDDSAPMDTGFINSLIDAPSDVAAVGAEVFLSPGPGGAVRHESGGLPEVFIGCGVAIRRAAFLAAGGYDASFGYYAEEYDLAAKFLLAGLRVIWDARLRVLHRKSAAGRDMNTIVRNLVRNNACIAQRYAPESVRAAEIRRTLDRYRAIAGREGALAGYEHGVQDLHGVIAAQPRRALDSALYERFTGAAHARAILLNQVERLGVQCAALVDPPGGAVPKHRDLIEDILRDADIRLVETDSADARAYVVASLSPGPMLDGHTHWRALSELPVLMPWRFGEPARSACADAPSLTLGR